MGVVFAFLLCFSFPALFTIRASRMGSFTFQFLQCPVGIEFRLADAVLAANVNRLAAKRDLDGHAHRTERGPAHGTCRLGLGGLPIFRRQLFDVRDVFCGKLESRL